MARTLCFAKTKTDDDSEIHIHRHHFTAFMHQQHGTYLALPFLNKQHFFSRGIWNKETDLAEKKGFLHFSSFWCRNWSASQIPHPSAPSSPLLSLFFLTHSPLCLPLLPKMARTLGLFSNYGPTFSEKVIIIRDPFSFSVESTKLFLWLWSLKEKEERK